MYCVVFVADRGSATCDEWASRLQKLGRFHDGAEIAWTGCQTIVHAILLETEIHPSG